MNLALARKLLTSSLFRWKRHSQWPIRFSVLARDAIWWHGWSCKAEFHARSPSTVAIGANLSYHIPVGRVLTGLFHSHRKTHRLVEQSPEQDFVYGFPLYFVAVSSGVFNEDGDEGLKIHTTDLNEGGSAVAIYTEPLLAERATEQLPGSEVCRIDDAQQFKEFCRSVTTGLNVSHVMFDPVDGRSFLSAITEFM